MDRRPGCAVGGLGGNGGRPAQAASRPGRAAVISLDVLYGFGALISIALFAYLVYALLRAEEF